MSHRVGAGYARGVHFGRALGVAVVAFVTVAAAGSGLAALPSAGNSVCVTPWTPDASRQLGDADVSLRPLPFGTVCTYGVSGTRTEIVHGPSAAAFVAWLGVVAAVVAVALRFRKFAAARGLLMAACTLGLLGYLWHLVDFDAAAMGTVLLGIPIAYAVDRALCSKGRSRTMSALVAIVLPPAVVAVWVPPGFLDVEVIAAIVALSAGALVSGALARLPAGPSADTSGPSVA